METPIDDTAPQPYTYLEHNPAAMLSRLALAALIALALPASAQIELSTNNRSGRVGIGIERSGEAPGRYAFEVDGQSLARGTYVYRLTSGERALSGTFTVAH